MENTEQIRHLYSLPRWSEGYVDAGATTLQVHPLADERAIDLWALAEDLRRRGLRLPVLVRFLDILRDRVARMTAAFAAAFAQAGVADRYTAVYPIKVNQQRCVVKTLLDAQPGRVGLEAGSKPELMVALALAPRGGTIVCNGYKDRSYVHLALTGERLGYRVFLVVEKLTELDRVLDAAQALGVRPRIGLRARLASVGKGNWQNTGGEKSKFGLTAAEMLTAVERLRAAAALDSLELLHFHLGSQVAHLDDLQRALTEASRLYVELRRLGAGLQVLDVGGGLAVDYEGTGSRRYFSMNYGLADYARMVVESLADTCQQAGMEFPEIFTESGRAMTAHHAVLLTHVLQVERSVAPVDRGDDPGGGPDMAALAALAGNSGREPGECWHEGQTRVARLRDAFDQGRLSLADRARSEQLFLGLCHALRARLDPGRRGQRELADELNERLADRYLCNFSVFQSLPDVWAIDQVFPIVPLHRLDEMPERRAVIHDLTCDSDGRIDSYVDALGVESSLPLHAPRPGEDYLLGIFLVGAYQEILGDIHNLFGDTDSVNVELAADGYRISEPRAGEDAASVLRHVHFDSEELIAGYARRLEESDLNLADRGELMAELRRGLAGYTYPEK